MKTPTVDPWPRRPGGGRRAAGGPLLALSVAGLAAAVTVAVVVLPIRFAYHEPGLHVAIETAATVVALTAAALAFGRFRRSASLPDIVLFVALGVIASGNLLYAAFPAALGSSGPASSWGAFVAGTIGAYLLAAAAFAPRQRLRLDARAQRIAVETMITLVALISLLMLLLRDSLPPDVDSQLAGAEAGPELVAHPVLLALQLLSVCFYAAAAVGFVRRAVPERDAFLAWLGVAAVLGAAARLNYFLYPSRFSEWVSTGDAFRFLSYLVIALAAAREIHSYWRSVADAAVLEERRRLARDLHDGLAQELRYVERHVRRLGGDELTMRRVTAGIGRAIEESRHAIAALSVPLDEPLDVALERAARTAGARVGSAVVVDAAALEVTREQREALVRITAEAVANAGRHGGAAVVAVTLADEGDGVRLSVVDRGSGFDPQAEVEGKPVGFGLRSMRERAAVIGAHLSVVSQPGAGTRVEVTL